MKQEIVSSASLVERLLEEPRFEIKFTLAEEAC